LDKKIIWLSAFKTNQLGLSVKNQKVHLSPSYLLLTENIGTFSPSESCGRSSGAQEKKEPKNAI
jgi:hypothetical protein